MLSVLVRLPEAVLASGGSGRFRITPAELPIQSRSLQTTSDVTRRQAVLCCRMMLSQPAANMCNAGYCHGIVHELTLLFTTYIRNNCTLPSASGIFAWSLRVSLL